MQTLVQFHQTQIYKIKINKKNQTQDLDLHAHEISINLGLIYFISSSSNIEEREK